MNDYTSVWKEEAVWSWFCVYMPVYWLLFLRNRAGVTHGSDWTILQEGTVLSSKDDDVITMEMFGNG